MVIVKGYFTASKRPFAVGKSHIIRRKWLFIRRKWLLPNAKSHFAIANL